MDDQLKLKQIDRRTVELLVAKQLTLLSQEAFIKTVESAFGDKKFTCPDTEAWARKIIAIVKEHSV